MPSGPSWSLRRAAAEDAGPVRGLALATFREAFAHAMPAPTLERLLAERFSEARFQDLIAEPEGRFFLAEAGSEQLGYALTHPARTPEAPGASWELSRLYVRRAFHGQGVGEALMAACVDAARAGGATGMWLKV